MRFEGDPKVATAKSWLQGRLEEAFIETSFYSRDKFAEFQFPPVTYIDGDPGPIVRHAVREFRNKSLECVSEGFKRLLGVMQQLQTEAGEDLADIAKNLTWDAIDKAFNWTAGNRSNSSRFKDWTEQAEVDFSMEGAVVMASPECNSQYAALADQLNCDFRTQFVRVLDRLRNEALLNSAPASPPNTPSEHPSSAEILSCDRRPEPYIADLNLDSQDKKLRGVARAKLVGHVRRELAFIRPALGRFGLEELASQYQEFIIFQERRAGALLIEGGELGKGAHKRLAFDVAAARAHLASTTMETAWKDYHKFLDTETK